MRLGHAANKGVILTACQNTMRARKVKTEDHFPFAAQVDSGVAELVRKQEAGWSDSKGCKQARPWAASPSGAGRRSGHMAQPLPLSHAHIQLLDGHAGFVALFQDAAMTRTPTGIV